VAVAVCVTLIDPFDTESALRRNCGDVRLDRVVDPFAVVALLERGHHSFALYPSDKSVRQIALEMLANLHESLSVLYCDHEQEAWVLGVFWSNSPATRNCE